MLNHDRVVGLWKVHLAQKNAKAAQSLADPTEYENLFPGLTDSFKTQQYLSKERKTLVPASQFLSLPVSFVFNLLKNIIY